MYNTITWSNVHVAQLFTGHRRPGKLMLYNLSVLEYINGAPPWYDVHTAVRRLPKFQEALGDEREKLDHPVTG